MKDYYSVFYGDVSDKGYRIAYLLISKGIQHDFIIFENYLLTIRTSKNVKELIGFDQICEYLEKYQYIFDFPEINVWKY